MLDSPIKFPSSPSSNEDELPSYHSYEVMSDYSPPWSSEEDPKEEDDADDDGDDFDDSDSDSDFDSPPPKQARLK
jgi:hypothetical protein